VVNQITPHELALKIQHGQPVYLLDVRQAWEHARAALPESVLIPLQQLHVRSHEVRPAPDALVVVYCHYGVRSMSGAAYLEQLGLPYVASLAGGIDAWSTQVDPRVPRY